MDDKKTINRSNEKIKQRGRPFQKNNTRGKSKDEVLANSGHESSPKRGILEAISKVAESNANLPIPKKLTIPTCIQEFMDKKEVDTSKTLDLLESIDFMNGENKLTIRLSRRNNRMFRIQVFLNDEIEIRPVTYAGSSTGLSYWKLLKEALKSK